VAAVSRVFSHTVGILRPTVAQDSAGDDVVSWAGVVPISSSGWAVGVGDATENNDARDGVTATYTLVKRGLDVDVRPTDRVRLFGEDYEVDGEVLRQPGPSSLTSHTIVRLKRAEG
jgi:hypothetical protein